MNRRETDDPIALYTGLGMTFGVSLGVALGMAFGVVVG